MNIVKKDDKYTLLIEISQPLEECGSDPFTFRFLQSDDMTHWTLMPKECVFQKDRYAGSPAIYSLDDDPYYYVTYLEAYPMSCYANCIARSKDLINWEYSLLNPVLMYDEYEDKTSVRLKIVSGGCIHHREFLFHTGHLLRPFPE